MRRSILLSLALLVSLSVSAFAAEPAKSAKDLHGAKGAKHRKVRSAAEYDATLASWGHPVG